MKIVRIFAFAFLVLCLAALLASCGEKSVDETTVAPVTTEDPGTVAPVTTEAPGTVAQVLFDLNGGSSPSAVTSKTVTELNASDFFFDVTKDGFNFRGWAYNGVTVFDENGNLVSEVALSPSMTFVAQWVNRAKLTIISNMPEAGEVSPNREYEYNTEVSVFAHPYQGYEFVGWFYENAMLSLQEEYNYQMWDKDVTLFAWFKLADFRLSLAVNDPYLGLVLINPTGTGEDLYEAEKGSFVQYTKETTIAAYTKTNIKFLGWFDKDGALVTTNAVYTFAMPNYDYPLTAKWNRFQITYDLDGGINAEGNPATYSVEDQVTLAAPSKKGYIFTGWSDGGEIAKGSMDNKTFTANWTAIDYAVTYNLNGGTNAPSNPAKYTVEDAITLAAPTRTGYVFAGWSNDGAITKGSTGDKTFTANWTAIDYAVTYNLNGGTNAVTNPATYTIEDAVTLAAPTRKGYIFKGWSDGGTIALGSIGAKTFVADWEIATYTVSYDLNGGTNATTNPATYTVEDAVTLAAPTRTGYTFAGWSDGGKIAKGSTGTKTFTANWTSPGLNYKSNGNGTCSVSGIGSFTGTDLFIPSVSSTGDRVTSIGDYAFKDCFELTSVTIPDSVTSIGGDAFDNCAGLISIKVSNENPVYHSTNNCLIATEAKTLLVGCKNSVIPTDGSVTSIGCGAFHGCTGLKSVTIPDSVTRIGEYAFVDCTGLTSVTFQNTSGWRVVDQHDNTMDVTVTNASTNATNLKSTYYNYYWYRK